jgi:hypothetical protein
MSHTAEDEMQEEEEEEVRDDFRSLPGYNSSVEQRSEAADSGIQVENELFSSQILPLPGRDLASQSDSRSPSPESDLPDIHRLLVAPFKQTTSAEGSQQLHYECTVLTADEPTDEESADAKNSIIVKLTNAGMGLFQNPTAWVESEKHDTGLRNPISSDLSAPTLWEEEQISRTKDALGASLESGAAGSSVRWTVEVGTQDANREKVVDHCSNDYGMGTDRFVLEKTADGAISSVDIETV